MKKLSEKTRKFLRAIYMGLGAGAVALMFQACYGPAPAYGMPPGGDDLNITGKVVSMADKPIFGIDVSWEDEESFYTRTGINGDFYLSIPREYVKQDAFVIVFKDVDGIYNDGLFKTVKKTVTRQDNWTSMTIKMSLMPEEE